MFQRLVKYALGLFFAASGVNHFISPEWYMKIMPPFLPWHKPLIYLSGVMEIALGLAMLSPRLERKAAWGIAALLLGVFPAHIYMVARPDLFPQFKPALLWLRLPLQFVLIGIVLWSVKRKDKLP